MLKQKLKTPTSISRGLLLVVSLAVLAVGLAPLVARQKTALAATNGTINFQARLLTAAGNVVPDGQYNVEFKLYNIDIGGTALWTETRINGDKVTVKNGYLTVNLGSVNSFADDNINWDQELWLTMNIGGTGSPSWDGEMNPRLKLTSVPYAFRSGAVVSANGSVVLTVDENDTSGKICVQNSVNCGFVQGEAADFIQNTTSPQTANINITSALNTSSAMTIQGAGSANVPVAVIKGGGAPGSAADILQLQNSANAVMFKVDNDGDAELARSLKINYVAGVANQLNIQGPSGNFVTVNSENNKFFIGDQTNCTGRFCVGYSLSGTGGASYTNAYNLSQVSVTSASTIIGQDIKVSDTSSAVNNIIRAVRIDTSGTTNTSATLNSFQIFTPETSSSSTYGGNALQIQQVRQSDGSAQVNLFKVTNTGQAAFQSTNNTATAFQILNSGGNAMFTLNTNGTNNGIYIGGGNGVDGAGGRLFFGATGDSGVWIGESGTTDTNVLALNGNSGLSLLVNNTAVASFSSNGALTLQNSTNSTNAAQIKNAAGTQLFNVDSTADSSNLVTNGSFEQNTNGWAGKSATLSPTTSQAYAGTGSLQITTSATNDAGAKQNVTLVANQTYTLSFMARSAAAFTSFAFGYSADGTTEATYVTNVSTMAVQSWTKYSMDITPTAVSGTPYIFFKQTTNVGRTFYIDAVQLDQVGNPYNESRFAINGSIVSPMVFQNASDSTNAFGIYKSDNSSIFSVDTRNSRVGIGAAAPQARLHVVAATGTATLINQTGATGNILELQRGGSGVVTVSNSGAMLLQPSTDVNNAFQVRSRTGSINALTVDTTGGTTVTVGGAFSALGTVSFRNSADSTQAFNIKTQLGNNLLTVDTSNSRVGINLGSDTTPTLFGPGMEINGALRLSGGITDQFLTPNGSSVSSKINIPIYDPGASGQILAFGLPAMSGTPNTTARALSLFDKRAYAHQPTLAVFSPDEAHTLGFSWDGSDTVGYLKATGSARVGIRTDSTDVALFGASGIDLYQDTAIAVGKTFTVSGTLRASTINAVASGDVISIGTTGLGIDLNQNTAVAADKDFTAQGAATFKKATDSTTAFRILNSNNDALFTVNTTGTNTGIYVAGTGAGGGGSRVFFGPTGDTGVWIGEEGTTSTNVLALNGNSGLKMLVNNTAVATISSNGAFALQNSTDSNFAFTIKSQQGYGIMRVDTLTRKIAIGAYPGPNDADITIGAQLEILNTHQDMVGLSIKGSTTGQNARYIDIKSNAGSEVFYVTANGDIMSASGVFGTALQNGVNSNSMSVISGNVTGSNVSANSGIVTIRSGSNTAGATGAITLMSGNATGTGTEAKSGSVTIDSGSVDAGGSGVAGGIFIGTNNAPSITIGNAAKTQSVNIGASFTTDASSTVRIATSTAATKIQTVTIGSTSSSSSVTINSGTGGTTFKSATGATAFRIINGSDVPLFTVNTSNDRVYIGNPTSDTTGALLVLDTKSDASDPAGIAGGMYYNSALKKMRCYEGDGYWVDCRPSARSSFFYSNDYIGALLISGQNGEMMFNSVGGTGGSFGIDPGEAGHPGLLQHSGAAIGSYSVMKARGNAPILLGGGDTWRFETMTRFNNPSDNNQTYLFKAGFIDSSDATEVANGCFMRYSNGTNGGRWQGVCRANNTETTCDVGGSAIASSQWYRLEVIVNSSGTSADFKATVNGTTTSCPISSFGPVSAGTSFGTAFIKTNGASSRNAHVDYIEVNGQLGATR